MAKADALLGEAIELPEDERAAFLARLDDDELRREVAELLRFAGTGDGRHTADDDHLHRLGSRVRDLAAGEAAPDDRVGAYRLVEEIGAGGMGVVYLADRADGAFEQRVALKLLPANSLSPEAVRRFERERQILANLSHEHIARLLDGGVDSSGRPFLVMELVDGLHIDRYCDRHRLDLRARLRLFRTVCRAVQYAHQNLVVHRDLKPGNILVTHDGVVKLLDFGIAKILDPARSATDLAGELPSQRLLSPSYASPEQIEGRPVTTATDVYSLGVVLFQLVTGQLPFAAATDIADFFARVVAEDAPPASACLGEPDAAARPETPSPAALRGTTPARLRRQVSGDLDAVIANSLAREETRRYPTAQQLGDDLGRLLDGLPVAARRGSPVYFVGKWIRRHAVAASLAALALAAVSVALIAALWQAREATRARALAEHEAAVARRISEVLVEVFERAETDPAGEEAIVETLLDPAAARIGTELADSPEVQAALMDALGRAYLRLGRYQSARPLAEEALALRLRSFPEQHRAVAMSQRLLGQLLPSFGELDRAASLLRDSLETLETVAAGEPLEIANGKALLSHALGALGEDAGCEELRRSSLEIYLQELGPDHPRVAQALSNLGNILIRRGQATEAEGLFLRALELHRVGGGGESVAMTVILRNLAQARLQAGRLTAAEGSAREAVDVGLRAYGPAHPNRALSLDVLAQVLVARGAIEEAEPLATEALAIYTAGNPGARTRTALMQGTLAEIALLRQDMEAAEARLEAARRAVAEVTPPGHYVQAVVKSLEGRVHAAQGRDAQARAALEAAFDELHRRQAPASLALRRTASALVELHEAGGEATAAERYRPWARPPSSP